MQFQKNGWVKLNKKMVLAKWETVKAGMQHNQ
jgi:hypothetical protein